MAYAQIPLDTRSQLELQAVARLSADGVPSFMRITTTFRDMMVR